MGTKSKDLLLIRASCVLNIVVGFTLALVPTRAFLFSGVAPSGLTTGFAICVRSLMTSLMSYDIAILYTTINIMQIMGIMIANPMLAALFRLGFQWGREWTELLFAMAGLLYIGALCIISRVKVDDEASPGLLELDEEFNLNMDILI